MLNRNGPNSFLVDVPAGEVKIWPFYALQVVKKALKAAPAGGKKVDVYVNVKVERAKKLEARNISEEDQAAALVAPARPRRARAKRVDYKALSKG